MTHPPRPAPGIIAVPATTPFVSPEELARRVGRAELVRLGANESAFGPAPAAIAAMKASVPLTSHYADPESVDLRTALARRHQCAIENIVVGSGIDELLGLIVRTYCAALDVALMTRGSYPTFAYHVVGHGVTLATVPALPTGAVDITGMIEAARARRPKIVYLANPDNPSGSFAHRDEVARLRHALHPQTLFILDEAYADFVDPSELVTEEIEPSTIRLRTFSKAHGMAGARIGYALAAPEAIETFQKIRLHFGINRTAQIGALTALEETAFITGVIDEVTRGREEYYALGERLGVRTLPSWTNFVCFEIGSRAGAEAMVQALLERGIFVRKPGAPPIDGYIRVTVGNAAERARFAESFADALAEGHVTT